ncbi:hypothetical protein BP6252_02477 [Coleophoma cylindrospora]|uniref:Metallo-beta-lactamase domain-containing protein n=1 Tax=Coleophoma cylindrospora TaxID=1849047 RepID=A0A3D8SEW2_9HELO|nr:hypothetical protein BP6252_02477 [Coleophoma cylindrospora]
MASISRLDRQSKLRTLLSKSTPRRPLLTHLNADNSWLLSVPIPISASKTLDNAFYHIIIDPWLTSPIVVATWILTIHHVSEPAFGSIADVETYVADIEAAASNSETSNGKLDAVLVSHRAPDHTNMITLLSINPTVPVFTSPNAFSTVKELKHFHNVFQIPDFGKDGIFDWRFRPEPEYPLPPWLGFSRLGEGEKPFELHFGIMLTYSRDNDETTECIILSPHGILDKDMKVFETAKSDFNTLAMLHTTKTSGTLGVEALRVNLGANHGLRLVRELSPRYWISTHDEPHRITGVMALVQVDKAGSVDEALELEKAEDEKEAKEGKREKPNFVDVVNGDIFLLD